MSNLIDKKDAIDAIEGLDWYHLVNGEMVSGASDEGSAWYKAEDVYKAVEGVPSVERKKGKWEICEDTDGIYGVCSECGSDADISHYGKAYNFCPNCGARMEEQDETD